MNANALYEEHKRIVHEAGQKVLATCKLPTGAPSTTQSLKEATTAYSMLVDKFLSFHSTMVRADGSNASTFGFVFTPERISVADEQAQAARDLGA